MKFLLAFLLTGTSFLIYSCSDAGSVAGCQVSSSYCRNYTGYSWYANSSDLSVNCSGTFFPGGCPENTAYAVCRKDDYDEDFNYEYIFYNTTLSADEVFSEDECEILNNN